MLDMKKLKGLVGQLNQMLSEADGEVVAEKEQYARPDDQGEESDGDDAAEDMSEGESDDVEDPKMKAKMMALMLKKKMGGA